MGEFVAWIIGWDLVLEYALGAATVAVSWSQYVDKFLANYGIHSTIHTAWSLGHKTRNYTLQF
jgi:APA family basic amino acid/polyamine antiporter